MPKTMRKVGEGRPAAATKEGVDASALLPPIALAAVMLVASAPVLASSGAGNNANIYTWSGISNSDGYYYLVEAPNPSLGDGAYSWTNNRMFFNRNQQWFNGVGYYNYNSAAYKKLGYQISDAQGNYIYYLASPDYSVTDGSGNRNTLSAGLWRSSGNIWHFNWWGPNFNVGVNQSNAAGGNNPDEVALGAEANGVCPNSYPITYFHYWLYRDKNSGYWNYMPTSAAYNWGNSPTWQVWGGLAWDSWMGLKTVGCP